MTKPAMEKVKEENRQSLTRRSSNYKKFINLANAFLTVSSVILICIALLLIYNYRLHDLDFWHPYFNITPILILTLGIVTFITSTYTFIIINTQNRASLITMAVLLSATFILQIASIYFSMKLKFLFMIQTSAGEGMAEVRHYNEKGFEWVKPKWDGIQSQFRCCGASESMNFGYQNYHGAEAFQKKNPGELSVPDSCCKEQSLDCGVGRYNEGTLPNPSFFTDGCLAIMKETLKGEVSIIMDVYVLLGLLVAIVELVSIVLASAYVAQISRRMKSCKNGVNHSTPRTRRKVRSQKSRPSYANGDEILPSLKTRESISGIIK